MNGSANGMGTTTGLQCLFGRVHVLPNPQGLVGATQALLSPLLSTPILVSQVVGPAGGSVSLSAVNGQFAILCGTITDGTFRVSHAIPLSSLGGGAGLGALGGGPGLGGL